MVVFSGDAVVAEGKLKLKPVEGGVESLFAGVGVSLKNGAATETVESLLVVVVVVAVVVVAFWKLNDGIDGGLIVVAGGGGGAGRV